MTRQPLGRGRRGGWLGANELVRDAKQRGDGCVRLTHGLTVAMTLHGEAEGGESTKAASMPPSMPLPAAAPLACAGACTSATTPPAPHSNAPQPPPPAGAPASAVDHSLGPEASRSRGVASCVWQELLEKAREVQWEAGAVAASVYLFQDQNSD